MIQEATQSHYRGVLCSHCRARTPISTKTESRYQELKKQETSQIEEDGKPPAFTLRCRACNAEGVYDVNGIQEFEGTPRTRASSIKNHTLGKRRTLSVDVSKNEPN